MEFTIDQKHGVCSALQCNLERNRETEKSSDFGEDVSVVRILIKSSPGAQGHQRWLKLKINEFLIQLCK